MPVDSNLAVAPVEDIPKHQGNFWDDWKLIKEHKEEMLQARPEGIKIIDNFIDETHIALYGTTFIKPSWWTELLKCLVIG